MHENEFLIIRIYLYIIKIKNVYIKSHFLRCLYLIEGNNVDKKISREPRRKYLF